jgi:hypothetical protein
MKKVILLVGLLLVAFNSYAGVCGNGSMLGAYNFNGSGDISGQAVYGAGRFFFNGKGAVSISGVSSTAGVAYDGSGSGTYSVSSSCVLSAYLNYANGQKTNFWIYLDNLDTSPAIYVAYHGSFVLKNTAGTSGSGTIDRVTGKF